MTLARAGHPEPINAPCRLGGEEVGAWSVANGLPLRRLAAGYAEFQPDARERQVGISAFTD